MIHPNLTKAQSLIDQMKAIAEGETLIKIRIAELFMHSAYAIQDHASRKEGEEMIDAIEEEVATLLEAINRLRIEHYGKY